MSVTFTPNNVLAFVQQHMDKYGEMMRDKMNDAERAAEMLADIAKVQEKLANWKANGSNSDPDGNGVTVRNEAIQEMEALIAKYPELADKLSELVNFARTYREGSDTAGCDARIQAKIDLLDGIKDAYGKHDQLTMLEINDLHSKYNRVAELANQFLSALNRTQDSIVAKVGQ